MNERTNHERDDEFRQIALPQLDALFALALNLTRNRADAEDLVQETFLRAYRFFDNYQPGTHVKAWLFRILRNTFINRYRAARARPQEVDFGKLDGGFESIVDEYAMWSQPAPNPEQVVLDGIVDHEIDEAIDALPEEYREVVLMALVGEMSYREIASTLSIPLGTVMSRLHRGRKQLQARLLEFARRRGIFGRQSSVSSDEGSKESP